MKIIYYKCPDCGKMIELPATVRGRIVCAYCGSSGWIDDNNGNPVIRQDGPTIPERNTVQKEKKSFNPLIFVGVAAVIGVLYIIGTKPAETHQIAPPGATIQAENPKETLQAGNVAPDELIEAVKEVAENGIGEGEKITGVDFNGSDLRISVDMSGADKTFPVDELALTRISSITDEVLDLDEKYYNAWETITIDFGPVGKATLDKSIVKDQGAGKFFDFDYDTVLKK